MNKTGNSVLYCLYLLMSVAPATYAQIDTPVDITTQASATAEPARQTDTASGSAISQNNNTADHSVETECRRIGGKLGSVSFDDCLKIGLELTGAASVSNAPIMYKEYAPLPGKLPQGKVLLLGGVHGDEYSSVSIVFKWLQTLDRFHSGLFHWRVIPLVNPDGLLKGESTRTNANGVDINRNFPTPDWDETALKYWAGKTGSNPRQYPGPDAASEPETAWLVDEIEKFGPDVIVSVHAPHGVVDYDGPEDGPHKLGRLYLSLLGTFPGSLGNYAGIQKNIPVVTIELPYAGIMPSPAEVSNIWTDLVRWLTGNIPEQKTVAQETDPS
jgi:protein MpaA